MAADATRVVLLPRFTSLVGKASGSLNYFSPPVNARAYESANLTAWVSAYSVVTFTLQQSVDLVSWSDIDTVDSSPDQEVTNIPLIETEWIRLKASVAATTRGTMWVVGEFAIRGT